MIGLNLFENSYEAGNGIKQQSSGFLKKISVPLLRSDGTETGEQQEADILVHTGSYSYTAPDGTLITLNYISDENGFQPQVGIWLDIIYYFQGNYFD